MADVKTISENQSFGARVAKWPSSLKSYIDELRAEMRRVTWPNWKQVRATTTVVIISVFLFAAYFAVVDLVIGRTVNKVFNTFTNK